MGVLRVIFTTSIIEPEREAIYVSCIKDTMAKISVPAAFYITENNGQRSTALDTIEGSTVFYTDTNTRWGDSHKGVKEFADVLILADHFGFSDDDIIIKQTGRYPLKSDNFYKTVFEHKDEFDVFMKFYNICTQRYEEYDCLMGLYGIRYSVLNDFNYLQIANHRSAEVVFASFVKKNIEAKRILEMKQIDQYFQGSGDLLV
jgi:hypothetical protein